MLSSRRSVGFSLIELMVALAILGVLIAIAGPSLSTYLQGSKLASSAHSYLSGVQLARTEAIRRNTPVEFVLTDVPVDTADIANSATPSTNGVNWVVRAASGAVFALVEAKAATEGAFARGSTAPSVQISGAASGVAFDGSIAFNGLGGTTSRASYRLELKNPAGGLCAPAGPMRCPQIRIPAGGQITLCDPLVSPASDSRAAERPTMKKRQRQRGVFLLEALIAILIFSLGILGMVAMGGTAMGAQSDARFRTDAANLANDIASEIWLNVDRTSPASLQSSLMTYQHLPTPPNGAGCQFSGAATSNPQALAWLGRVTATGSGLPGAAAVNQQIVIDSSAAGFNRVQITVCWQAPSDTALRRHTLVTYVNPNV